MGTNLKSNFKFVPLDMLARQLEAKLRQLIQKFPAVAITGPRQSGKTTLVKSVFSKLPYCSLENPDDRQFAIEDPRSFLGQYPKGVVLDEVQRVPELFSYLQGFIDAFPERKYILSGSQNFLLMESISQSLAGRVAILKLLPFSISELSEANLLDDDVYEIIHQGFYPPIFDRNILPEDFYPNYIQTYIERDVRQITQVGNLNTFTTFVKLCAGRAGQLLNMSELANSAGITVGTVKSWISVLETSFILFRLHTHHKNFNKRLIKMPKLYFYDTGLLCYLLGIEKASQIRSHFAVGALFENFIIADMMKQSYHSGKTPNMYFWRDHKGREVDLIIEKGARLIPIEIKSSASKSTSFFNGLKYWNQLSGNDPKEGYVVYGGMGKQETSNGYLLGWREISNQKW